MSEVTTQVSNPTAADISPKNIELTSGSSGGLKIFEPAMKDPTDQLVHTLERIEELKNPGTADYVGAFSPETDIVHVQTGNAQVTQLENLAGIFSTAPELPDEGGGDIFILVLVLGIGYFLLKGKI